MTLPITEASLAVSAPNLAWVVVQVRTEESRRVVCVGIRIPMAMSLDVDRTATERVAQVVSRLLELDQSLTN